MVLEVKISYRWEKEEDEGDEDEGMEREEVDDEIEELEKDVEMYIEGFEMRVKKKQVEFEQEQFQAVMKMSGLIKAENNEVRRLAEERDYLNLKNKLLFMDEFRNLMEELKELSYCPIVWDIFSDPILSSFGHVYDYKSINKWYSNIY